jgi:hypothetical protein
LPGRAAHEVGVQVARFAFGLHVIEDCIAIPDEAFMGPLNRLGFREVIA